MSVGLLDVNMLLALAWPSHIHHGVAHRWFAANQTAGWATCPMTQCAFVRISSNPRFTEDAEDPIQAAALLEKVVALKHHEFWADDLPFTAGAIPKSLLVGHQQITDAYLLGLAAHHGGRLVTLDQGVSALLPSGTDSARVLEIVRAG